MVANALIDDFARHKALELRPELREIFGLSASCVIPQGAIDNVLRQ
jgi:hypothetical protein